MRSPWDRPRWRGLVLALSLVGAPAGVAAQAVDSARVGTRPPAARSVDTLRVPPVTPSGAFLRSALLPGLGQAALKRPVAGAVFFTAEVLSLAMLRKTSYDLREARRGLVDTLVIRSFQTQNGREVLDSLGLPVVGAVAPNRWTQGGIAAARATFREDWIAAIVFTHLIAGIDAFVAAQLWDLPAQVSLRPAPMGGTTLSVGWRWR